ncbi:MAG: hypothetical protein AAF402_14000 [Pseudomonadota bacterium]
MNRQRPLVSRQAFNCVTNEWFIGIAASVDGGPKSGIPLMQDTIFQWERA